MKSVSSIVEIFQMPAKLRSFIADYTETVEDIIKIDDDAVITIRRDLSNYTHEETDNYHNSDVNIASWIKHEFT